MWAASLSDIFNAILDGIVGFFSAFLYADIPMLSENVIVPIVLVAGLGFTAYWTHALLWINLRKCISELRAGEYWIDKGVQLIGAIFCIFFGLIAFGVFVTCIIFLGEFLFT